MTDKPYTDTDVDLVAATFTTEAKKNPIDTSTPPWMPQTRLLLGPTEHDIARAVLDALAAAGRLAPADDDPRHIIQFRPDGWTIKHPLSCRLGDLFGCPVNLAAEDLDGPPAPPGRYAVTVDSIDGRLRIGERVDQEPTPPEGDPADAEADQVAVQNLLDDATRAFADADTSSERVEVIRDLLAAWYAAWPASAVTDEHEPIAWQLVSLINAAEARAAACPCLPGAPAHRHGKGGYSTSGERAAEAEHLIAFAGDGTWTLEHPTSCQPAAVSRVPRPDPAYWDCAVRQLAERQITPNLAALVAGGRYTCSAGTLGDVFQLGERLHDDQCTTPVCAACGCWCHAEEQPGSALDNADVWGPEPPCFHCGQREADHVDGRCPKYRPTERKG